MDDSNASREPSAQTPESAEADFKTTNSASTAGPPKPLRPRAKFDDAEYLPGVSDELTPRQITRLFYQGPTVRQMYQRYFDSRGKVRKEFFPLIFKRLPTGELRHPVTIITSNVLRWEGALRHFEEPDRYDAKGQLKSKSRATIEEPSKKRKRGSSKTSVQHPDNDETGESHAEETPFSTSRAGPSSKPAPGTHEEAASTHDLNGRSNTAGESGVPSSLISTESASPVHAWKSPVRDYVDPHEWSIGACAERERDFAVRGLFPAVQSQAQFASSQIPQSMGHTAPSGREVFPPVQGQAQLASSPTIQGIEHTASGREHYDEPMTEDPTYDPTDWDMRSAAEALMAATALEESPGQQNLSPDSGRVLSKINLSLTDVDDLPEFTQWIHGQIHNLNLNLREAPAAGKCNRYKHYVADMVVNLLTLQKACFNFEVQLRREQAQEE